MKKTLLFFALVTIAHCQCGLYGRLGPIGNGRVSCIPTGGVASPGANLGLSNLSGVSINTSLIPQTGVSLGGSSTPFKDLYFYGSGSFGANNFHITGTPTAARTFTLPDANSNGVQGIANPSDTNVINYIGTDGVQNRIAVSAGQTLFPGVSNSDTIPDFSTWSWINQGGASFVQNHGSGHPAVMSIPQNASPNWRLLSTNLPSTPFSFITRVSGNPANANSSLYGNYFYDGTKLMGIECLITSNDWEIRVEKITNVTTDGSTAAHTGNFVSTVGQFAGVTNVYLSIGSDGTTLYFLYSIDGNNWATLFSEAVGTYITPTKISWGGLTESTTSMSVYLNYYRIANTVTP